MERQETRLISLFVQKHLGPSLFKDLVAIPFALSQFPLLLVRQGCDFLTGFRATDDMLHCHNSHVCRRVFHTDDS